MAFLSKVVFPNFKSANHVHLFQDHHTLDSDEPDFVHQQFHNGAFPTNVPSPQQFPQNGPLITCDVSVDLIDNPADPAHEVQVSYPFVDAHGNNQIHISIPIHVKIFNIQETSLLNSYVGNLHLLPLMGIETQLLVTTTDLNVVSGSISTDLSKAEVSVGPITPAGSEYGMEGPNYNANEKILHPYLNLLGHDLASLLQTNIKSQGESLLQKLPPNLRPLSFPYPKPSDIQKFLAEQVRAQLVALGPLEIFPGPSTVPPQLALTDVAPMVLPDALAIALNSTSGSNASALVNFVPAGDSFAIAISAKQTIDMINKAIGDQFPSFPVVMNVKGHDVRLKSLNPSLTSAIHFSGDLTAINVILGIWDVDASFDEDVGLEWLPPDPTNNNAQKLKANTTDPDVHLSGLAWLLTILAGLITDGIAGAVVGAVIVDIVQQIASNIGGAVVVDKVSKAISAVGAWPSPISGFKVTVNSAFNKNVTISPDGLLFGG